MTSIAFSRIIRAATICAVTASALATTVANAACFQDVGCTNDHEMTQEVLRKLTCDSLWLMRNTIFHEAGYCFHTERAEKVFSNDHCSYRGPEDKIPLNQYELTNITRMKEVEYEKACPLPVFE
jgi:hypothetical protein